MVLCFHQFILRGCHQMCAIYLFKMERWNDYKNPAWFKCSTFGVHKMMRHSGGGLTFENYKNHSRICFCSEFCRWRLFLVTPGVDSSSFKREVFNFGAVSQLLPPSIILESVPSSRSLAAPAESSERNRTAVIFGKGLGAVSHLEAPDQGSCLRTFGGDVVSRCNYAMNWIII